MSNSTLYEIDNAIIVALEAAADSIDPETGEILYGSFEQLEALAIARDEKLENTGAYIKNLTAQAEAIKAEENALKRRRQAIESKIDRYKGYVSNSLEMNGQAKFEGVKVVFSFRKSTSVEVLDLEAVPAEYITVKTEKKPDKTAIGKLLKAGEAVAGCELKESRNLQIK